MPRNQSYENFAKEAVRRYDEFIDWAINQWPASHDPLTPVDFAAGKRELSALLGARLSATQDTISSSTIPRAEVPDESGQYLPVTPAPWP